MCVLENFTSNIYGLLSLKIRYIKVDVIMLVVSCTC